jgi:prophage regulatory protein
MATTGEQLLRWKELREIIPLSRSSVWRQIQAGVFPAPLRIGKRAKCWRRSAIDAWIADRAAESKQSSEPRRTRPCRDRSAKSVLPASSA